MEERRILSEDNECPECGQWKGEDYEVCFNCHTRDEDNR